MADAKTANAVYAQIGKMRALAKDKHVDIPENAYAATCDIATALLASNGDEEAAMKKIIAKFGRNKRSLPAEMNQCHKKNKRGGENGGDESESAGNAYTALSKEDVEAGGQTLNEGEKEAMPPHKTILLVEKVREKKATNPANQKIVDAFANYGEEQLDHGHTGKGVSHLRAALHIRDHPDAITSAKNAHAVPMVGNKIASQIEEVLVTGKLKDQTGDQNVSTNVDNHQRPELVLDIHKSRAKYSENQVLVDELAKFGEHELYFGSSGKGTSHLRAAREIQLTDQVIKSGSTARTSVPLVGDVIADKIDQILKHGRIVKDTGETPIVKDLREKPATCPENQAIVNVLIDYGDGHLHSGHRGKGISHLRAAQAIRDSKTIVKSGKQASQEIDMVGQRIAAKIDQIIDRGHADSDEDYEYDGEGEEEDEEGSEYGERKQDSVVPPIVMDVCSKSAMVEKNQRLVDALVKYGEEQLYKRHTGRGTAFLRAARRLRDADEAVNNGNELKALGGIGDRVAARVDKMLAAK